MLHSSTYQSSKVIPHFGNVWIQTNSSRIRIQGISILINLVIKNTNRAPKGGISAITIDGLLVGLVSSRVFLLGHVTATKKIPALSIILIYIGISKESLEACD